MADDNSTQIGKLEQVIKALESHQREYGVDFSAQIIMLKEQLSTFTQGTQSEVNLGSEGDTTIGRDVIGRDQITHITINPPPLVPRAKVINLPEALQRYLDNLIDAHQHLRLQGIRAGGQPLSVDLEKVYVSLTAKEKSISAHDRANTQPEQDEPVVLTVSDALKRYRRLVILGDPGSGKTTLLAYLALTYARDLRDSAGIVQRRLGLNEGNCLPIFLPLRDFGRYLKTRHPLRESDGSALLLDYLRAYYAAQSIILPEDLFVRALESKYSIILLDGMDEVAEVNLRQRVARLIESFVVRFPGNRLVVASREVGYDGASRIGGGFGLVKVRDFSREDVRTFVRDWTRIVEVTLSGHESRDVLRRAAEQAGHLISVIESSSRISELAVNPLLLTVIALIHRYRAQLPERRAELYEEAIEVLLARWDEAKGLEIETNVAGQILDAGDRRALLEPVALWLHEQRRREIELDELRTLLIPSFLSASPDGMKLAKKATESFVALINARSGLLIERGIGVYSFAHLTFQEYLAARALTGRPEAESIPYTCDRLADPWWREVILLEAGYLSSLGGGKRRVSELIRAIIVADPSTEPEPYHHLILAAECLSDVGVARIDGNLLDEVKDRLRKEVDAPFSRGDREIVLRKVAAANALGRIESGQFGGTSRFWQPMWGESDWVRIPRGRFWMGEPQSFLAFVPEFNISRVPITNAQYSVYVADKGIAPPEDWRDGRQPPKFRENHPVVNVSWHDALGYCQWLSEKVGKQVRLPTEAEWEKAARGDKDRRDYPWGTWTELRCNSSELGLGDTSPVGLFMKGSSPYGVLDMAGNVWEWCQSKYEPYPYHDDGRESLEGDQRRVLRGGSYNGVGSAARCTSRSYFHPAHHSAKFGFRVVMVPSDMIRRTGQPNR